MKGENSSNKGSLERVLLLLNGDADPMETTIGKMPSGDSGKDRL